MDSSVESVIDVCVDRLVKDFEHWNKWLGPDYKMYPCPDKHKVRFGFERAFGELGISEAHDQKTIVEKVMDIYSEHANYEFYGPDPLEEFSAERISEQRVAIDLVRSYVEAFPVLENGSSKELLSALEQDLEFMETVSEYISNFYTNGNYKFSADARKKELIDFCLPFNPKKTKVYSSLERLWAIVYQEKSNGKGDKFKSAYSRAKNAKNIPRSSLKKDVSRYIG